MNFKRKLFIAVFTILVTVTTANASHAFNLEAAQAYNQALDLYINGKTTDAITQFERATTLDPNFSDAYYNLGSIYRYTGQLTKAQESFQKVLNLKPNDTSVNYDLALVSIQQNDLKRAYSYLKLVSKESERYNDAQTKISFIKRELGESALKNVAVTQTQSKNKDNNKEVAVVATNSPSQVKQNDTIKNTSLDSSNKNTFNRDEVSKNDSSVSTYDNSQQKQNNYLTDKPSTNEEEIDVKPAKLTISKKEWKEELKAEKSIEKKQHIKLEDTNLMAQDQSDTAKFWDKYNFNTPKNSNERTETVKQVAENNENLAVNYYTVEDTSPKAKLKLSSKNKKEQNKTLPFKNSDNNPKTSSTNTSTATRLAIKTFATGFNGPTGMVRDNQGNLFVANYTENKIYKVNKNGDKTIFASSEDINGPLGLAMDDIGNIYVANYLSNSIARITPEGSVTTVATGLKKPYFLYFDNSGMLYVSEQDSNTISEIKLSSKESTY